MKFTQMGWGLLVVYALIVIAPWAMFSDVSTTVYKQLPFLLGFEALLFLLMGWFTIEITADSVRVRFGAGLIRRTWPLDRIVAARPVRNSWWAGWGIRLDLGYSLYNVSGLDAVELTFRDGSRKVRLGTDQPEALTAALAAAIPAPVART